MAKAKRRRRDIYKEVTDQIVDLLEAGTVPWRNPITRGAGDGWPKNLQSRKTYRGINVFLLAVRALESGFSSDYWLTFKQAQAKGGMVRKGEKSSLVVFWKQIEKTDPETGEETRLPVLRHYNVFNADQCSDIEAPDQAVLDSLQTPLDPIEAAETIISGYERGPPVDFGGSRAFYRPSSDLVVMPEPGRFDTRENFYSTFFHELSHSTGHSSRLDRGLDSDLAPFGSPDYSREELIAEMSAAFLCAAARISPPTIEQSAAYLQNWCKVLKGDHRLVIKAAGAAQKATDHILGTTFSEAASPNAAIPPQSDAKPVETSANTTPPKEQLNLF